jgi:hypothetical protein
MTLMCYVIRRFTCCAVLGYYTTCSGNSLPTFRHNLSVPSLRVEKSLLPNIPQESISHLLRGGSQKWPSYVIFITCLNRPQFFCYLQCMIWCDMVFIYCKWVSTRWLWSVNLYNDRKETAICKWETIHKTIHTEYTKLKTNIQNKKKT